MLDRLKRLSKSRTEKELLKRLANSGIPRSSVQNIEGFANRKPEEGENYYYYSGPMDEKTRKFCYNMLMLDKVWSESDIYLLSIDLNYDVNKYMGSYNCRHKWVRFRGKIISTPAPTSNQIRKIADSGIVSK